MLAGAAYATIATLPVLGGNAAAAVALAISGLAMVFVALGAASSKTIRQL
jgi:hypothetical protein